MYMKVLIFLRKTVTNLGHLILTILFLIGLLYIIYLTTFIFPKSQEDWSGEAEDTQEINEFYQHSQK